MKSEKSPKNAWPSWISELAPYEKISRWKTTWQLLNSLVPYISLWYLMIFIIQSGYSYVYILPLVVLAAAFLVRIFILFHDCVHSSLFKSKGMNKLFGYILGTLAFTPFEDWKYTHLRHHGTYANLDTRGFGDIWIMTKKEYEAANKIKKLQYRLYRNPFVLFGLGSICMFSLSNRLPDLKKMKRREAVSIVFTNLLLLGVFLGAGYIIGWKIYLIIQLPVIFFAWSAGIWLFYVQHQFKGGYWARTEEWDPVGAAMEGSSFYNLPAVLRWFSGNIGFHHVHHLNSKIPNYLLKKCYDTIPQLRNITPLSALSSITCFKLKIWDEEKKKMTGFEGKY